MALGRLFSALPVRQGDPADQIEVYVMALADVSFHALDRVVLQAISGQHAGFSKRYAPSTAELGAAIRDEMAAIDRQAELARERMALEDNRPLPARTKLLHERQADARAKAAEERRAVLFTGVGHDVWLSKARECIAGSIWVAITGEIYGPPGSLDTMPAATTGTDDIPW